jgi:two-component system, response regulator FlrC
MQAGLVHLDTLLAAGEKIGADGLLTSAEKRVDQGGIPAVVAQAAFAAEQITGRLVGRTVAQVERDLILATLRHCLGNRTHAASILGISIRTLRNKLNEYVADGAPVAPPARREMRGAV